MTTTTDSTAAPVPLPDQKTFLGHPRGLFVLFFAEMWERFSYYGMRAILVFYLIRHWMFSEDKAYIIYGAYTALVYVTPVIGGYLADRYIGQRKAVQFGAILLVIGHGLMAFEGTGGQDSVAINAFWLALAFIIMGVGFLKANISVIVGQLYGRGDARRDPAFTIFYMGINLGALLGSLIVGYLGETYGWSWGFGAAGVGMLLGLIVFVWGRPTLLGQGEAPDPQRLKQRSMGLPFEWHIYLYGVIGVAVVWALIQYQSVVGGLLAAFGALTLVYWFYTAAFKLEKVDRHRIYAALFLIALQPLFWALFEQAGSSLNVFTDQHVDRVLLGWEVPASMFQSINSMYILLLGPFFAMLWLWLARRKIEPSTPAKFGIGLILLGMGFLVLVAGVAATKGSLTPVVFIFLIYMLHTAGELCLSPVGLSAMSKLAPVSLVSVLMGTWFLASAGGNYIAGMIARATGGAGTVDGGSATVVMEVYNKIGWVGIGAGVAVILVSPFIRRLMHEGVDNDVLAGSAEIGEPAAAGIHPEQEQK